MERSVPAAIELKRTMGDRLNLVLVDFVHAPEHVAEVVHQMNWEDSSVIWTNERPFFSSSERPALVLLDASGKVVLEGNAIERFDTAREMVEREVEHLGRKA